MKKIIMFMAFVFCAAALLFTGCAGNTDNNSEDGENIMDAKNIVVLETSKGNVEIELDFENAPISSQNFIDYVNEGFYDGLIFHRVIDGFMVQGGGFDENLFPKETHDPIRNEAKNGLSNLRGTVAMARTNVVDSATSQFFINVVDNNFLDHVPANIQRYGYAVFGKVVLGMDVVDEIKSVETTTINGYENVPMKPIFINKAYVKD